ncbi:TetR/AcrR family transcriptional regulator [Nonomuraea sp. KC401]|uniref:TetR/AcrR family transcriptional regulator n=1 Tax=unclassified Nonomuraea TaxID=2593643 RepID=UPI0010FDF5F5|nr:MULTISPECIES: TetR/AcrR family transcriptional regulator [unclassified Nonomuraea]TLF60415.1 TetR/AcrR family transcriptional regulator [Nonomuraea sp. KC401]
MRGGSPARRRGRPPKSAAPPTRDRLVEAALELFARQGYAATSLRQIAEAVGVRESAIYAHFSGKQALYDVLFTEAGPPSLEALPFGMDELVEAGPAAAIPEVVNQVFSRWASRRARLFASVMLREGTGGEGIRGLAQAIESSRDLLAEPFRRWQEAGLLRSDVPAGQLVWELFAPLQVPRFLYLRADATDEDLARATRWAEDHVAFFLTCTGPAEGSRST